MAKTLYRVIVGDHFGHDGSLLTDIQECEVIDAGGRQAAVCYGLIYYEPFHRPQWHTTMEAATAAMASMISQKAMKLELQAQMIRDRLREKSRELVAVGE